MCFSQKRKTKDDPNRYDQSNFFCVRLLSVHQLDCYLCVSNVKNEKIWYGSPNYNLSFLGLELPCYTQLASIQRTLYAIKIIQVNYGVRMHSSCESVVMEMACSFVQILSNYE